jgi:Predicted restriction endonuclease
MAITDKNRKTLWARSGNRCAMCRTELVAERNEHDRNLNIGDECHIVSEQPKGPRHDSKYEKDFDDYENLILLCKNHHKTIDELWETYTVDLLKTIKINHENWIKTVIDNAKRKGKKGESRLLPRITTGKQIVDIIREVAAYQFDHCDFNSQEEADFVSGFLQNIQDWGEVSGFGDFEIGRQIQLGYDLNKDIEELEQHGFFLFGERRSTRMTNANKDDLGIWDVATLIVLRKDNPLIINNSEIFTRDKK